MNITQQIVHCRCPKNSISYLIKREPLKTGALGYTYLFACSPQSVSNNSINNLEINLEKKRESMQLKAIEFI